MRTVGIAAAWLTIGFGIGMLLRAVLILGQPRSRKDYER